MKNFIQEFRFFFLKPLHYITFNHSTNFHYTLPGPILYGKYSNIKSEEAATGLLGPRDMVGVGAVSPTDSSRTSPECSRRAKLFQQKKS